MHVPSIPPLWVLFDWNARTERVRSSPYIELRKEHAGGEQKNITVVVSTELRMQRLSEVLIKEGESFEAALKRFTRKVQQDGLLSEAKRRQHYEPPSVKRKRKADARARKARKARAKLAAQGL
jgi:small subunit ribosomal protein S21